MRRYMVFAGILDCPNGGWNDFVGSFHNKGRAIAYAKDTLQTFKGVGCQWSHVVDGEPNEIIEKFVTLKDP